MASGSSTFSNAAYMNLYVVASESNVDVGNNRSRVNVTIYLRDTTTYFNLDKVNTLRVWIDGVEVHNAKYTYDLRNTNQITLKSGIYRDVTHNSDGAKTVKVKATFTTDIHGSATVEFDEVLTKIARASQPSLSDPKPVMGSKITITTNTASSSFRHSIYHDFHDGKWTKIADNVTTSHLWTVPTDIFAPRIPNSTSGNGRIQVDTWNGSTFIGSRQVSFTASVPTSAIPKVGSLSVSDLNTNVNNRIGSSSYVQTLSKPRFTAGSVEESYKSPIKNYEFKFDGYTYTNNGTTKDFPAIRGSGTLKAEVVAIDSRGRKSAARTLNVTVLPYSPPQITGFSLSRVGTDSNLVDASRAGNVSALSVDGVQKNKMRILIESQTGTGSWTSAYDQSWTNTATANSTVRLTGTYSETSSFNFRLTFEDHFSSVSRVLSLSTKAVPFSMSRDGVGVGKVWESGSLDVKGKTTLDGAVDVKGNIYLDNNANIYGKDTGGGNRRMLVKGTDNDVHINPDSHGSTVIHGTMYPNAKTYLGVKNNPWIQLNLNGNASSPNASSPGSGASINFYGSNSIFEMGVGAGTNDRNGFIQTRHSESAYATAYGQLKLNPLGGSVYVGGQFDVAGPKNAVHVTRDGIRATPAYETAESYLGDIGENETGVDCRVRVYIEKLFQDTVNTTIPYQVFLQSYSKATVWLEERHPDYFVVCSSEPLAPFAWELKAKRRGYENDRMVLRDIKMGDIQTTEGLHGGEAFTAEEREKREEAAL